MGWFAVGKPWRSGGAQGGGLPAFEPATLPPSAAGAYCAGRPGRPANRGGSEGKVGPGGKRAVQWRGARGAHSRWLGRGNSSRPGGRGSGKVALARNRALEQRRAKKKKKKKKNNPQKKKKKKKKTSTASKDRRPGRLEEFAEEAGPGCRERRWPSLWETPETSDRVTARAFCELGGQRPVMLRVPSVGRRPDGCRGCQVPSRDSGPTAIRIGNPASWKGRRWGRAAASREAVSRRVRERGDSFFRDWPSASPPRAGRCLRARQRGSGGGLSDIAREGRGLQAGRVIGRRG